MKARKGQLGFDFLFALVTLLVLFQFLIFFSSDLSLQQEKINIRNQEEAIALKVKSLYNACQIADMGPASNDTTVTIRLPVIYEIKGGNDDCMVNVDSRNVTVSHTLFEDDEEIDINLSLSLPEATGQTLDARCGETITVVC
jgi:hypothetical protein